MKSTTYPAWYADLPEPTLEQAKITIAQQQETIKALVKANQRLAKHQKLELTEWVIIQLEKLKVRLSRK